MVFMTDYCLMQVKSIAECFNLSILEWPFYTGFTVILSTLLRKYSIIPLPGFSLKSREIFHLPVIRVATVREKVLENEKYTRSGKSQGTSFSVREI